MRGRPLREYKNGKLFCSFCSQWKLEVEFRGVKASTTRIYGYCHTCRNMLATAAHAIKIHGTTKPPVLCAICSLPFGPDRKPCWDHDPKTGAFRDWLCYACNTGLGKFRDDPVLILKAIAYLERSSQ